MEILITTSGRSHRQPTLDSIPEDWLPKVRLVVQEEEEIDYLHLPVELIVLPKDITRLSPTREYLAREGVIKDNNFILADDDLKFAKRSPEGRLLRATPEEVSVMLYKLEALLDTYYNHVGVSQRFLNRDKNLTHIEGVKALWFVGYDTATYRKLQHNRLEVMSDVDYTLQLFEQGEINYVLYDYAMDQVSQADGGCSIYRNYEMMERNAKLLEQFHPGIVTAKRTQGPKNGYCCDSEGYCWRTSIKWKKALEVARA